VAGVGNKLVGSIQGSVKPVEFHDKSVRVGYVLGLRVVPSYRRRGIGSILVRKLEEWFESHNADYAYMATEKDNEASHGLFIGRLGYVVFRNPAILVNPVNPGRGLKLPSDIGIRKLKVILLHIALVLNSHCVIYILKINHTTIRKLKWSW